MKPPERTDHFEQSKAGWLKLHESGHITQEQHEQAKLITEITERPFVLTVCIRMFGCAIGASTNFKMWECLDTDGTTIYLNAKPIDFPVWGFDCVGHTQYLSLLDLTDREVIQMEYEASLNIGNHLCFLPGSLVITKTRQTLTAAK